MKASDLFVKILEKNGVETIYGVPGEENLDLLDSIGKSNIELILTRNEQTAVFMAANYGRYTGKAGVALATLGPGATNMMTGVAYAQLGGMPVILITGQKPQNRSKQGKFQIIDVVSMMRPVTKASASIVSGARIPYMLENAFQMAEEEKPGAVCLELPEDIAAEEVAEEFACIDLNTAKKRRPIPDEKAIQSIITELEQAKHPMILVGAGANRKLISKYLTEFITQHNIPFFNSQMGKGVVDERLDQCLGTAALTSGDTIHEAIAKADLIVSVGYDVVEKPTDVLGFHGTKVIDINFYSTDHDYMYSPYLDIIGDIGNVFWQLCESDIDDSGWDFEEVYAINRNNKQKMLDAAKDEQDFSYMMPRKLCSDLRATLGEKDILALDNGLYKVWIARNYPAYYPNTVLLDNALATMGAGYATAMEAKRLNPDRNVVCVTGDGGLVMNLGDLETIVRLGIDMVLVVLNNSSYGMIKWKQTGGGFDTYGLDFGNPDFIQLAESFGARGFRVEDKNDFQPTLEKAMGMKGLTLIDLRFEYPEDGEVY
ncbi:acetolactate synthase large subunit [Candidatus Gracilibacteria bacterium]|nr:acetolactate synthase large subunit [Candidatus Gracilibacteria bacterium]